LGGGALYTAVTVIGQFAATTSGPLADLTNTWVTLQIAWIGVGVVLVALGEVFARGISLAEETEGLI
jgi:hypothetical protein